MEIFLSSETDLAADKIISPLRTQVSNQVGLLLSNSPPDRYGTDIITLCIISVCVSDDFLKDSNWKERVRYSKSDKTTDICLNIHYDAFLSASKDVQYRLYMGNIIESIRRFHLKYPKLDFQAEKLIDDITEICNLRNG